MGDVEGHVTRTLTAYRGAKKGAAGEGWKDLFLCVPSPQAGIKPCPMSLKLINSVTGYEMADSFKTTISVSIGYQRQYFDKNLYFMREDGLYCLPPGEYSMPFPMWGSMAVERSTNKLGEKE